MLSVMMLKVWRSATFNRKIYGCRNGNLSISLTSVTKTIDEWSWSGSVWSDHCYFRNGSNCNQDGLLGVLRFWIRWPLGYQKWLEWVCWLDSEQSNFQVWSWWKLFQVTDPLISSSETYHWRSFYSSTHISNTRTLYLVHTEAVWSN